MAIGMTWRRSWFDALAASQSAAASPATPLARAPEREAASARTLRISGVACSAAVLGVER